MLGSDPQKMNDILVDRQLKGQIAPFASEARARGGH